MTGRRPILRLSKMGLLLLGMTGPQLLADDPSLAVEKIPAALRKNATAVVRRHEMVFEASRDGGGTLTVRRAVTVFDAKASSHGIIAVWYDTYSSVEDMEATILDADGEEIESLSNADIEDHAGYDGLSLAQDVRIRVAQLTNRRLPYTIVYEYEVERKGTFMWPSWHANPTRDAVEFARFEVRIPDDGQFRWWCNQDSVRPAVSHDDGDSVFVWEVRDLPSLPADEGWEDWEDATIVVRTAPNDFAMEGRQGSLRSWGDFGAWFASLWEGRRSLAPGAVQEVQKSVEGASDVSEKISRVYHYMQQRTRYVSIQLGLGGWQPFEARTVHEKGYGDCKALSNYTIALLEAVGINAYPVILQTGYVRRPFLEEFPSNQFNHVIVCVPVERDTVWLECTSQSLAAGRIGGSSEARQALLLKPGGGSVVRLPESDADDNLLVRSVILTVEADGSATAQVRIRLTGNQHDRISSSWNELSAEGRSRMILRECGMPEAVMSALSIDSSRVNRSETTFEFSAELPNFASRTGQRMFIPVEPFERRATPPPAMERRLSPVNLRYRYRDLDTIVVRLPKMYQTESLPKGASSRSSFATFQSEISREADGGVRWTRDIRVSQPVVEAAAYDEFRRFFQDVARSDRSQIVLARVQR